MSRRLNFEFTFPPIYGKDSHRSKIYIYGEYPLDDILDIMNDATYHYVEKKVQGKRPSPPKFEFRFPPWCPELYDSNDGTMYIFGGKNVNYIMKLINHASIHFTVQKKTGKKACLRFDKLNPKLYEMD